MENIGHRLPRNGGVLRTDLMRFARSMNSGELERLMQRAGVCIPKRTAMTLVQAERVLKRMWFERGMRARR